MLLLAFETSAKAGSVALMQGGKLLAESYQNSGLTHSQTIMPMAENMLKSCGFTAQDVTHVAVAAGPGSFTGIRIGVAAAKGFAWGSQIPCYGISTLEAMARGFAEQDGLVVCTMDARRCQVYNAIFEARQGTLTRLCPDRAISLEELGSELESSEKPIFLVGDGSILCYHTLKDRVSNLIAPAEHRMHQRAAGVALAAWEQIQQGVIGDGAALEPNYLRLSQAERERQEKEKEK